MRQDQLWFIPPILAVAPLTLALASPRTVRATLTSPAQPTRPTFRSLPVPSRRPAEVAAAVTTIILTPSWPRLTLQVPLWFTPLIWVAAGMTLAAASQWTAREMLMSQPLLP